MMPTTITTKNLLETSLYDGLTLVNLLLSTDQPDEAARLASQLLVSFPQALPLHVGLGRALLRTASPGRLHQGQRALGHLRRVLDSDPENWPIRVETALYYLRQPTAAPLAQVAQELWLAAQAAPWQPLLGEVIADLPHQPAFEQVRDWLALAARLNLPQESWPTGLADEGGAGRLYLRADQPRLAVSYFEEAARRLGPDAVRPDLYSGLLTALWRSGETSRASALASQLLQEQPQLILPRLVLVAHLARTVLQTNPARLLHLIGPVWKLDPLLERSTELAQAAGLVLPPELWPPAIVPSSTERLVTLNLGLLDREWLESLLKASQLQAAPAGSLSSRPSLRAVSFSLREEGGRKEEGGKKKEQRAEGSKGSDQPPPTPDYRFPTTASRPRT